MQNAINIQTAPRGGERGKCFPPFHSKAHAHSSTCTLLQCGLGFVDCNVAQQSNHLTQQVDLVFLPLPPPQELKTNPSSEIAF